MLDQTQELFLVISLPQHIRGTLQASSDPDLQPQAFFTSNSRPQVWQTYRSPVLSCHNNSPWGHLLVFVMRENRLRDTAFFISFKSFRKFIPMPSIRTSNFQLRSRWAIRTGPLCRLGVFRWRLKLNDPSSLPFPCFSFCRLLFDKFDSTRYP